MLPIEQPSDSEALLSDMQPLSQPLLGDAPLSQPLLFDSAPHSPPHAGIAWVGVDWLAIALFAIMWELVQRVANARCARYSEHKKIVSQGGSYVTAFLNAWVCSIAGLAITTSLLCSESAVDRAVMATPGRLGGSASVTPLVLRATQCFVGWLFMDVLHIVARYPELGGVDMLLHHCGFIGVTLLDVGYGIFPFAVGWLLLGEISSIFLNLRWLLINSGRGASVSLTITNAAFAGAFFLLRVGVLWAGIAHELATTRPLLLAPPYASPAWAIDTICVAIVGAALLNAFWAVKIVRLATRPAGPTKSSAPASRIGSPRKRCGSPPLTPSKMVLPLATPGGTIGQLPLGSAEALAEAIAPTAAGERDGEPAHEVV